MLTDRQTDRQTNERRQTHLPPPLSGVKGGGVIWTTVYMYVTLYLVSANVFKITQWVVKTTLHDTEVLVQFVHVVGAVAVQLAGVRLLPSGTFDGQRRAQLVGLQLDRADPQRPFQLTDFFLETLPTSDTTPR